jgi:hypothetical protein
MTTRDDFDEDDWQILVFSPAFAANGVAAVDGKIDKQEMAAFNDTVKNLQHNYAGNELIRSVMDELPSMLEDMNVPGSLRYVKTRDEVLWAYRKIGRIVDENAAPEEAAVFKSFLVNIVEQIANVSGKKLNLFGNDVNQQEAGFIEDVKNSLLVQ